MKKLAVSCLLLSCLVALIGCGGNSTSSTSSSSSNSSNNELVYEKSMELSYAQKFNVDYYKNGYTKINVTDDKGQQFKYLTVPKNQPTPKNVDSTTMIINVPLTNAYVANTPTTSLINAAGGLNKIALLATPANEWFDEDIKNALNSGKIQYSGKYDVPNWETIQVVNPSLSIYSTMLFSKPEVEKKMKELELPYFIDYSSFENHPLARIEWVKLYGILFDCEIGAETLMKEQAEIVKNLDIPTDESKKPTVAVFYILSSGKVTARNRGDYMTKMVEMAGGKYIFNDDSIVSNETGNTQLGMEPFFNAAKSADYIIYIYSLGGKHKTLDSLLKDKVRNPNNTIQEFDAVKSNKIWSTSEDYFQVTHTLGTMIADINKMITTTPESLDYLFQLK